jgi:hypothetical protein
MRPDQLRLLERLSNGEDGLVERKPQTVKNEELRRTVVAFANTVRDGETAVLFIGVSNTGNVLGVDNPDELQKKINRVTKDCYPRIKAQSYELESDGKRFIAVEIPPSDKKPHFAGAAYIRLGSESVEASEELYNELIATHCSLAGQILKWKDKIITVRVQGKRLGDPRPLNDPGYRPSPYSCRVVGCSPVHVELKILGYGDEHVSEPLANVRGDWDVENQRLCLLIRPAP